MEMRRRRPASANGISCCGAPTQRCGSRAFDLEARASISISTRASTPARGSRRRVLSRSARVSYGLKAQQIALTKPTLETRNAEAPPIPEMGPPPEVIFSDPDRRGNRRRTEEPRPAAVFARYEPRDVQRQRAVDVHDRRRGQHRRRYASRGIPGSRLQIRRREALPRNPAAA